MQSSDPTRAEHHRWLAELTALPTAAGKEHRVVAWIERWCAERPALALTQDRTGNLTITIRVAKPASRPVYFTAHLDHPAFVVEEIVGPQSVVLGFRGGVLDAYFVEAPVVVYDAHDIPWPGVLAGELEHRPGGHGKRYAARLTRPTGSLAPGDVGVWDIGPARIADGHIYTLACDDLAAAASALAAIDTLSRSDDPPDARVLFTRAEEIGFIGAIAACKDKTMPPEARVIALENSRSFADSPIGGGPIVRVGDRLSIFSPSLTDAIAKRSEQLAGDAQKSGVRWLWQRKLMAGGACEATVFCAYGYEATCVCLPLGNYHNMAELASVQAGTNTAPARIGPEYVSLSDFDGMTDLLVACGADLPESGGIHARLDKLWNEHHAVLAG